MKYWVLYGVQGDPLIEADRPTLGTLLSQTGYRTAMAGKWHLGLRYRRSDGAPAEGWEDADLTQPIFDGPLEHGFDECWFTSRSHGTSGPAGKKKNGPRQTVGPGHIHGRRIVGATGQGKQLVSKGRNAYVLNKLGSRHSDHAIGFLDSHIREEATSQRPFFLYYPANSNHGPHTPDASIDGVPVAGASRSVSGQPLSKRADYVYENDVALGRLIRWLENNEDPRRPGHPLIENTIVVFTSDNGAEIDSRVATGPFRSNKGSCYEGGHRVPFLVAWPNGQVGDGDAKTPGANSDQPLVLTDLFATFAEITGVVMPRVERGEKGGEDSISMLPAWRAETTIQRPFFSNDHKQSKVDPAVLALRLDDPIVDGKRVPGMWKAFFGGRLARFGEAHPFELYNLRVDPEEQANLIDEPEHQSLLKHMTSVAIEHRCSGGHRLAPLAAFGQGQSAHKLAAYPQPDDLPPHFPLADHATGKGKVETTLSGVKLEITSKSRRPFDFNARGMGISGGKFGQVEMGEEIEIRFSRDVIVESIAIVAGNGKCGGHYQIGSGAPLPIYCVDADNDSKEQHGQISDLGVVRAGEVLRLAAAPQFASEPEGQWRFRSLTFRRLRETPSKPKK